MFVSLIDSYEQCKGEEFTLPSQTIPGQSYSAKQAASLALRNIPVPTQTLVYDGEDLVDRKGNVVKEGVSFDDEAPDFSTMDKLDIADFQSNLERSIKEKLNEKAPKGGAKAQPTAPESETLPENLPAKSSDS